MILVEAIDNNSFKVSVTKDSSTEHIVLLSDRFHQDVTNNKLTKTELITHSFDFLLNSRKLYNFKNLVDSTSEIIVEINGINKPILIVSSNIEIIDKRKNNKNIKVCL